MKIEFLRVSIKITCSLLVYEPCSNSEIVNQSQLSLTFDDLVFKKYELLNDTY